MYANAETFSSPDPHSFGMKSHILRSGDEPMGYDHRDNLHAYVENDPINFTDPSGLCAVQPCEGPIVVKGAKRGGGLVISDFPAAPLRRLDTDGGSVGGGGSRNPEPNPGETQETDEEYQEDLERCRRLSDAAARSRCYQSAELRDAERRHGREIPPLITWREAGTLALIGTILYWVVSVGSRFVFPPRNLVPVP